MSNVVSINDRQKTVLKIVIDKHSADKSTVSSLSLTKTEELKDWSSATIRNDMVVLEAKGYLKREHFSSGKIPTKKGYELYIRSLMEENKLDEQLKKRLLKVFATRNNSIDQILDECATLISNFINLPIVVVKTNRLHKEVLKKIDLVSIDDKQLMIYLITSSGEVIKDFIYLQNADQQKMKDLFVSIRLLNEQLCDCPISSIKDRLSFAEEKIKEQVFFYEFVYEALIIKVILKNLIDDQNKPLSKSIYNSKALVQYGDINASSVLELLDKYSTFYSLNYNYLQTGNTWFNLEGETDNGFALATTDIELDKTNHKLSVVGPIRMNYALIKHLLDFLNEKIKSFVKE